MKITCGLIWQSIIAINLILIRAQNTSKQQITLKTQLGKINGFIDIRNARIFYSIPYGKSPTGNRKFAKPEPFGKWNGNRNGRDPSPFCPQRKTRWIDLLKVKIDVDCLKLNIYTPVNITEQLPVMVWIHGGGYVVGGAMSYDGSALAKAGNVVVVTINYRLGLEGFLSFGDTLVKGNYGIWDQILALRWIKDNIKDYGGDPNEVTIFGESAGGMSVSLLSLIPSNKGLFKRAIMQSGVANSLIAFQYGSRKSHREIGDLLGCPFDDVNSSSLLHCMRQVNMSKIVSATTAIFKTASTQLPIGPVIDGELFKRPIKEIFNDASSEEIQFFRSLDIIVGTSTSDGSVLIRMDPAIQKHYGFNISNEGLSYNFLCNVFLPNIVADHYNGNPAVSDALCKMYGKPNDQAENSRQAIKMYGDIFFLFPAVETLTVHATNNEISKTYQYVFSESSLPFFFEAAVLPPWFEGAGHATDLIYLFFIEIMQLLNPNLRTDFSDYEFAAKMRTQWTNFAKYGNPNGPKSNSEDWPTFEANERKFLQLSKNNMTVGMNYRGDQVHFLSKTVPGLIQSANTAERMRVHLNQNSFFLFLIVSVPGCILYMRG
ncbi:fatty acyl-CoA hydrolase precursor, medium chain-like [Saccostrea echinata]|uniref:fatty acyl-CoA hydrolase precursor, medium chain-like n=1 Tax=Saccostrea echinata TaxID=191078 RepID=UPI002A7EA6A9|nr:fatty acyl-CoA hydrolase precursor, medium chain-like [Saccostrea echinata]